MKYQPTPFTSAIHFGASVRVELDGLATLSPQQVDAFFGGLAKVVAAQSALDSPRPVEEATG